MNRAPRSPRQTGHEVTVWSRAQARALGAVYGVAGALVVVGWYRTGGTEDLGSQVAWLELTVASLVVASAASCTWLVKGRRSLQHRARPLWSALDDWVGGQLVDDRRTSPDREPEHFVIVVASGVCRYHRPACPLTAGKRLRAIGHHDRNGPDFRPCGVCEA